MKAVRFLALMLSLVLVCVALFSCNSVPTLEISDDGYWVINGEQTDVKAEGADGKDGAPGKDGSIGEKGDTGAQGPQGSQGPQGDIGATGATGPQGPQGATGATGPKGETGATIAKVEYDEQDRLIITLTDGTVLDPVKVPQKKEHVHTFGALADFGNNEGLSCDKRLYCKVCSECLEVQIISGSEASHDYSKTYSYDKSDHWFACSNCSATTGKATHNIDDDGACTVCKNQITPSKGVVYAKSSDGTYAEVIDYTASATQVSIAEEYEGVPVRCIAYRAFENKESITSVFIPDSVTSIGSSAFAYCDSLTSINIPNGVTSIGANAFQNCVSLTSITIPDSVTSIGEHAFSVCTSLTSISIGNGVSKIAAYAFESCRSLTSITIPDSVTGIANNAFLSCTNLTSITIPSSVTFIGSDAFTDCFNLIEKIDGVSYIANFLIEFDNSTASVSIREGTTLIANGAFSRSSKLRMITIPDSVMHIGDSTFYYCTGLTSITFGGTTYQWTAISKGPEWNYGTGNYTVYCTDGNITK